MTDLPTDWFDAPVAQRYDDDAGVRFTEEHLALETGFLADLAGDGGSALELAIGTGRVALPLARRGVRVSGIDLSSAMVEQLRGKPGANAIEVVVGDMTRTRIPGEFDVAYLVFNTLGNVTSQDGQVAVFENAAAHLRSGGCFVVETSVPGVGRTAGPYRTFAHEEGYHGIDEYDRVTQAMWSHHYTAQEDGRYRRRSVPFRYAWPAEQDLMARIAGMRLRERWGWWDRRPFTADSPSHVSVWEKS